MRSLFQVFISGIVLYISYYAFVSLQRQRRAKALGCGSPPQKPTEFFYTRIAKLIDVFKLSKPFTDHEELRALYDVYGHTFLDVTLTGEKTIRTIDERNVQAIHSTHATEWLIAPMRWSAMHTFMGNGFITSDGAVWERSRNLLKPSFHRDSISDLTSFEGHLSKMIEEIPTDGSTIDLQPLLLRMFYDTSSEFLLGKSIGALTDVTPAGSAFWEAFQLSLRGCGLNIFAGRFKALLPQRLTTDQFDAVHRFIDAEVQGALKTTMTEETQEKSSRRHRSLLHDLLQQTRDPIEIRYQLVNALAAAQDTTPTLLSNSLFALSRNLALWARVRAEASTVPCEPLTAEATKRLKLIRHVLLESLRLYPLFSNLGRMAGVDTVLPVGGGGPNGSSPIYISAGTRVMSDFYTVHRSKTVYGADPDTFDPDRWDRVEPGPWSFMAFGGGPRSCLGRNKALAEAACVLVRLAQRFDGIQSRDEREWEGAQGLVARNKNGCLVTFTGA